jgi:endoglucanase
MKTGLSMVLILLPFAIAKPGNVFVNQVGYLPNVVKYVYATQQADSFYVIEKSSNKIFYSSNLLFLTSDDPNTGLAIYRGDFSTFSRPGVYFIKTKRGDVSFNFTISDSVYKDLTYKSLKGFYFQRCGMSILTQYAGIYARSACHLNDGYYHSTTGKSGFLETKGGWHDAGDYGKYVVNAGISVGTLLMAYEYFPSKFTFDNLNIPESGNSIPDILDEVRYELNWLLKMQDSSGGVYFKETRETFAPFEMPNLDTEKRYIYQISSTATGDFAAVMARAARVYSVFDNNFSDTCLKAAEKAWAFLKQNPTIVPSSGFKNPGGTNTGEYGDGNDSDERLWAAAELFAATGDSVYNNYFISHYTQNGLFSYEMSWQNVNSMAQLTYLFCKQNNINEFVKNNLSISLNNLCSKYLSISSKDYLNVDLKPGEFSWGSNSKVLNRAIILIMGYNQTDNVNYYNSAIEQLNYILGLNGNNISYVTGVGSVSPMHPHHRPSASDGVLNPVPGLMAGGPDQYLEDAALTSAYTSRTPPELCYLDSQDSYASNEIAINWNAPLVFVSGFFTNTSVSTINKLNYAVPSDFKVYQNFPNPFNPTTKIKFSIPNINNKYTSSTQNITLKVYDSLGREITTLINSELGPGIYEVSFNGLNLSSGEYFYQLKFGEFTSTKKMILLK